MFNKINKWADQLIVFFGAIILSTNLTLADWVREDIGAGVGRISDVTVGNGRNDDTSRVYAACCDSHIYEFTYYERGWIKVDVGSGGRAMHCLVIGTGRNDTTLRIYAACEDNSIYEFSWTGGGWTKVKVGEVEPGDWGMSTVAIGAARNDDTLRLYTGCFEPFQGVYEFSWDGVSWIRKRIGTFYYPVECITVANGRNDGVMRLYIGTALEHYGHVVEKWYQGGSWPSEIINADLLLPILDIAVGPAHNDDTLRVYAGARLKPNIIEITWSQGMWGYCQRVSDTGRAIMYGVAVGAGHNDGAMYIYGSNQDSHIYEFLYKGEVWKVTDIGFGGSGTSQDAMYCVAVGNGRNDDTIRVYGGCQDNHIYEFTYRISGVEEEQAERSKKRAVRLLQNYPNPFSQSTVISYQLPEARIQKLGVRLTIYDLTGRLIKEFNHLTNQPFNWLTWDGKDDDGNKLPTGLYFCKLEIGKESLAKQIILLR
ncbi:MAG: T9SS type A sorting domain-containing protein [bacterium]|nr:T9SS type A sorting domain-containing protein [bacterium]